MNNYPLIRIIKRTEPLHEFLKRYGVDSLKIMEGAYFAIPGLEHVFGKVNLSQYEVSCLDDYSSEKGGLFHVSWIEEICQENRDSNALYLHKYPIPCEDESRFEWRNLKNIEVVNSQAVLDFVVGLGANSLIFVRAKNYGHVEDTEMTLFIDENVYTLNDDEKSKLSESLVVSKLFSNGKFISYLLHNNDDNFWENLDLNTEDNTREHFSDKIYPNYRNWYPEKWDDILGDEEAGAAYWNLD